MNLLLKNEIRRCRPLLGTFVEIATSHDDERKANAAIDAAFRMIEHVQGLMSFHDPGSEVSRLNRQAVHQHVAVSRETYWVLEFAKELFEFTGGIFDVTIASELMEQGALPIPEFLNEHKNFGGRSDDIDLGTDGKVRFLRPLCVDLGGIAKGFAVDQAVGVLQSMGLDNGLVNAGGDIRCFGDHEQPVWVRHPQDPEQLMSLPALRNASLATSANSYSWPEGKEICPHIDGRTRRPMQRPYSVSVKARSCMVADALTKVVLAFGTEATIILLKYRATAFIAYPDGRFTDCGEQWNEN